MSIITRINKAEKRIVDLYNKLKNLPSGSGGVQTISGDYVDNTDPLNPVLNDPRPYKVYTALLTQSGTSAPVATVLENTLGGEVVWSRTNTGSYQGLLAGVFTENKTYVFGTFDRIQDASISLNAVDVDTVTALVYQTSTDEPQDDWVFQIPIEIRVYN